MPNSAIANFASGETSPRSRGRFDLAWFRASAEKLFNFIPEVTGPARFRAGFKKIRQTRGGAEARLVQFQINSSLSYMLEFSPGKLRVYKNEDLITKTPFNALTDTDLLDDFTDGDYTSSPVWTPYVAANVAVVANELVLTVPVTLEGTGVRTPQTRNIGTFEFDVEITDNGDVMFFATTFSPTVNAAGITSLNATGYGVRRAGSGTNYKFGRYDGAAAFTELLDLGVGGTGQKTIKVTRNSAGVFTCFVGGTQVGEVTDTTYASVAYFAAQATTVSAATLTIDDIKIPSAGVTANQGVITGITQANPAVVTVAAVDDLADGDECIIEDVKGMLELNGRQVKLANNSGSTFELTDPVTGANIDSTSFGAYTSGGRLKEIYEVDTPYYAPDLDDLSWAVSARDGIMYIAHPKYELRKLTVDSADNFTLVTYTRTNDPFVNKPPTLTVTDIDLAAAGTTIHLTPGSVVDPNATYTFSGVVGTTEINGGQYRLRVLEGDFPAPRANIVTVTGENEVDSSTWTAYVSGGVATPDNEHPVSATFYESRLLLIGTSVRINSIFGSRAPDNDGNPRYDDFTGGTDPDHAVFFALAPTNGQIDAVAWARGTAKYLFVGTFGGPFRVSGGGLDEPITPTSINVRQFDSFGCEAITPVVSARVFWLQRGGTTLRTVKYDVGVDDIRSFDMLLNAEHIAYSRLQRVVIQTGRPDVLWVKRADGVLAGVTIQGDENVAGWHRQQIGGTNAKVLDMQPLARTDRDDQLWVVTERTINGVTRRFVEILTDDTVFPDLEDFYTGENAEAADRETFENVLYRRQEEYIHLDAAGTFNGADRGRAASATLTPGATSGTGITFSASKDVFDASDVGLQIWRKPDRDTGAGAGRATITGFTDAKTVTVDIDVDIPFNSTDAIPAGDWYFATKTIYGLAYLDGATVGIVTDGAVLTDGRGIVGDAVVVSLGKITLNEFAAVVHVGLPYEGFIKTHNLELGGRSGPAQSKPRNIAELRLRFLHTLGTDFGTDIYDLQKIEHRDLGNSKTDRPAPVFSGIRRLVTKDKTERETEKHIFINQRLPLPCVVQQVDIDYDTTEE